MIAGCEYGDRADWCHKVDCSNKNDASQCCKTCRPGGPGWNNKQPEDQGGHNKVEVDQTNSNAPVDTGGR